MSNAKLYGSTSTEQEAKSLVKCREIAERIVDFGVTENELARIIYLLSIQLENRQAMLDISAAAKSVFDKLNSEEHVRAGLKT